MYKEFLTKLAKNTQQEALHYKKAQIYLQKYIRELQLHFDLSDKHLKKILAQTQAGIKIKNPIQIWLNMLKF